MSALGHSRWVLILGLCALSAARLFGAEDAKPQRFSVAAGPASAALSEFARQSGRQLIYPTELVAGLDTREARGDLAPIVALRRMLAGTGLACWEDERTGALAIGALGLDPGTLASGKPRPVVLPPFVVAEKREAKPETWRYATGPGFEVISQCSDDVTAQLTSQHASMAKLLERILPASLQFHSDVPVLYVFFDPVGGKPAITGEVLSAMQRRQAELADNPALDATTVEIQGMPNFRFWDQDAHAVFYVVEGTPGPMMYAPSYVHYMLERRTPTLPPWFADGFMEFYQRVLLKPPQSGNETQSIRGGENWPPPNSVTLQWTVWTSPEVTRRLEDARAGSRNDFEQVLLQTESAPTPLAELFAPGATTSADPATERRRVCTSALFIRWALTRAAKSVPAETALRDFVDQLSRGAAPAPTFQRCFGLDLAAGDAALGDCLFTTIKAVGGRQTTFEMPASLDQNIGVTLRDATPDEISRIKGGFNRLEIGYVQQSFPWYPEVTADYLKQARLTLRRSYKAGDRDPRLLAELGLCECDGGNDAAAVPFLEGAVAGKVVRPRAYYELARIRYATATAKGQPGPLTPVQLQAIVTPLLASRGQAPRLSESSLLLAEALLRAGQAATPEQLSYLTEATGLFPRHVRLLTAVALVLATNSHTAEARALVEAALAVTAPSAERDRLLKLQTALAAGN